MFSVASRERPKPESQPHLYDDASHSLLQSVVPWRPSEYNNNNNNINNVTVGEWFIASQHADVLLFWFKGRTIESGYGIAGLSVHRGVYVCCDAGDDDEVKESQLDAGLGSPPPFVITSTQILESEAVD